MAIFDALNAIQIKLNAPKSQRNNFGNYNYRSCEDILAAVKPLLEEQNVVLLLSDELVMVGDRYYVKATAKLVGFDGNSYAVSAFAREEENKKGMDGSQITGSASSYARKYALNGLFGIDDVKDSDYTDNGKETAKPQQKPTQTAQSVTKCDCCGAEITQFKDSKTGEVVMPLDWAKRSRSRYGKVLCFNCIRNGNN